MSLRLLANVAAFQLGWFACVLGGATGRPYAGALVALLLCVAHVVRASSPRDALVLVLIAAGTGAVFERVLLDAGLVSYHDASGGLFGVPLWMIGLWMLFATTANVSLRWLRGRTMLAIAFGAVGGPLAYWGGERLGALTLSTPWASLAAIGAGWAVLFPLLLRFARHFDGHAAIMEPRHAGV